MQKHSRAPLVAMLLSLLLLTACSGAKSSNSSQTGRTSEPGSTATTPTPSADKPAEKAKVKLALLSSITDAATMIALEQGFFADENLDIEVVPFASASDMTPALATGQLDVGGGAPSPGLFNAIGQDLNIRIVADKGGGSKGFAFEGLMVSQKHKDSGRFKDIEDLKGMKIAVSARGVSGEYVLTQILAPKGLKTSDLKMETMPFPQMMTAMSTGAIDGAMVVEPYLTLMLNDHSAHLVGRTDAWITNMQSGVILYGAKFIQERPDVAYRWMKAYVRGARFYNDGVVKGDKAKRETVVKTLVKRSQVKDPSLYDQMQFPTISPDGKMNRDIIAATQDWFMASGYQTKKLDLNQVIDERFIQNAVSQLGPYQ